MSALVEFSSMIVRDVPHLKDDFSLYGHWMRHAIVPGSTSDGPVPHEITDRISGAHHAEWGEWPDDGKLAHYWFRFVNGWNGKRGLTPEQVIDPKPPPPQPSDSFRRIHGEVHPKQGFVDDKGVFLPIACHMGDLFSLFIRDPDWAEQEARDVYAMGYQAARVWFLLGGAGGFWTSKNRQIIRAHFAHVTAFAKMMQRVGLKLMVSMGDLPRIYPRSEWYDTARGLGKDLKPFRPMVVSVDGANEGWNGTRIDPRELFRAVRGFVDGYGDVPVRSTTDSPEAELDRYHVGGLSTVTDVHGYRHDHWWDKIRHAASLIIEGKPPTRLIIQSEPPGLWDGAARDLISADHYDYELTAEKIALLTAQHLIFRQWSVVMSNPGVHIRRRGDFAKQTGLDLPPKLAAVLPPDVMRWTGVTHGGRSQRAEQFLSTEHDTALRADQVYQRQSRVATLYGPHAGHAEVRQTIEGKVYSPAGVRLRSGMWRPGAQIPIPSGGAIFVGVAV